MVLTAMLISGAVAGLSGLPLLLGDAHSYSLSFPTGLGFTGITIALLGRNNPVGIAFAALLIAFLDKALPAALDYATPVAYEKEIATIMQGLIVFAVVIDQAVRVGACAASRSGSARSWLVAAADKTPQGGGCPMNTATVAKPQAQQPGKGSRRSRSPCSC